MTRTYQAEDYVEPVSDTMMEQFGNGTNYNVINGCEISYSAVDLTVAVSAGNVTHNGSRIAVAGNSITLVPNATNPLWAWVTISSAGVAAVTHGTAAADPTIPESGDTVEICLIKVEANQTIANNCAYKLDKRFFGVSAISTTTGGTTTVSLSADQAGTGVITSVTDLAVAVEANTTYMWKAIIHYTAAAATDYYFRWTAPGNATGWYQCFYTDASGTDVIGRGNIIYLAGTIIGPVNGFGTTTPGIITLSGSLTVGSTAGFLQFKHSCATDGKTKAKSRIELY